MKSILVLMTFFFMSVSAFAVCKTERTIGVDYGQAKYNCEAVLKGEAFQCQRAGTMWYCSCNIDCIDHTGGGSQNYTRTIGTTPSQARYNCEAILRGQVGRCERGGNMWYCGCYY